MQIDITTATADLIGRGELVERLAGRVAALPAGAGALLLVGAPGVGTTALLAATAARAAAVGVAVVNWPDGSVGVMDGGATSAAVDELVSRLTAIAHGRAALVIVDHLHLLDDRAHDVLARLIRRLADAPVLVLAATRSGARSLPGAAELMVEPLDWQGAARLVDRHGSDLSRPVHRRILADAMGNPLALVELCAAWRQETESGAHLLRPHPPLTQLLLRRAEPRLRALSDRTATVALVAALDPGRRVTDVLHAASRLLGGHVPVAALDPAVAVGLFTVESGVITFSSPLTSAAVIAMAAPGQRQQAYGALAATPGHTVDDRLWFRALSLARADEAVAAELESTAQAADRRGETVDALRRMDRAIQLSVDGPGRVRRLISIATYAYDLGNPDLGAQYLDRAERAGLSPVDNFRVSALRRLYAENAATWSADPVGPVIWGPAATALAGGDASGAAALLAPIVAGVRAGGRWGLLAQVQGVHVGALTATGDWVAAGKAAAECLALAKQSGQPGWYAVGLAGAALVAAVRGDTERAWRDAAEAEIIAGSAMEIGAAVVSATRLARGVALLSEERYPEAYAMLWPAITRPVPSLEALTYAAEAAMHCGQADAVRSLVASWPVPKASGATSAGTFAVAQLQCVRVMLGLVDADATAELGAWPWLAARVDLVRGTRLRRHYQITGSRTALLAAQHTFDLLGAATWARRARRELRASGLSAAPHAATTDAVAPTAPTLALLSAQELQIVQLAATGLSNREIGQRLFLSPRTIGSHLYRVFPKLDITSRAQLGSRLQEPVAA